MTERARIESLALPPGRRILVMSDIHGNLPYFEGLLEQVSFCAEDVLILDGDLLEKGAQSLALLRRAMALSRTGNVHTVCGNCDGWARIFDHRRDREDGHFSPMCSTNAAACFGTCAASSGSTRSQCGISRPSSGGSSRRSGRNLPGWARCPTPSRRSASSLPTRA
ncbi:MAG: metallophosphoesterase family protein [Oscillospiraceae bacterium]|nr:metallophosphoesterase family protein [Oscillospiraceae bacterium]